jgi:fermentation-respiration switch protein FrsA (DUF1100 family)
MVERRDVEFEVEGGDRLRGWLFVPENRSARHPAISMAHGYAGVKEHGLERFARAFAEAGFVVLVHDHRNFGSSDGAIRHDIDPWGQIADWRRAVSLLESLPGFEPVDWKDLPPRATTARGMIGAGLSGINAGIAGMLGAPVDIANTALRGVGLPAASAPAMGSTWLRNLERRVGINPDLAAQATTPEKIAHAAGYGAAAPLCPPLALVC